MLLMFKSKDKEILEQLRSLNERVQSLFDKFDTFIIKDKQYREQLASPEVKMMLEETQAYEIGYKKGWQTCLHRDRTPSEKSYDHGFNDGVISQGKVIDIRVVE